MVTPNDYGFFDVVVAPCPPVPPPADFEPADGWFPRQSPRPQPRQTRWQRSHRSPVAVRTRLYFAPHAAAARWQRRLTGCGRRCGGGVFRPGRNGPDWLVPRCGPGRLCPAGRGLRDGDDHFWRRHREENLHPAGGPVTETRMRQEQCVNLPRCLQGRLQARTVHAVCAENLLRHRDRRCRLLPDGLGAEDGAESRAAADCRTETRLSHSTVYLHRKSAADVCEDGARDARSLRCGTYHTYNQRPFSMAAPQRVAGVAPIMPTPVMSMQPTEVASPSCSGPAPQTFVTPTFATPTFATPAPVMPTFAPPASAAPQLCGSAVLPHDNVAPASPSCALPGGDADVGLRAGPEFSLPDRLSRQRGQWFRRRHNGRMPDPATDPHVFYPTQAPAHRSPTTVTPGGLTPVPARSTGGLWPVKNSWLATALHGDW